MSEDNNCQVEKIENEQILDDLLSEPSAELVEMMKHLKGDLTILGIAGKMGVTLGKMALKARERAGAKFKILGVARFSDKSAKSKLESWGMECLVCDLLDREAVSKLPKTENVIYMAGRKFGTAGSEDLTWAMNVVAPTLVAEHFDQSRIVVFSTGCVYPIANPLSGGCREIDPADPIGEYAQSSLGRERVFSYYSGRHKNPIVLYRLFYAIDMRYGVLHDIASKVFKGEPVELDSGHFNCIWQGDANDWALRSLSLCSSPVSAINATGSETISVRQTAEEFGRIMGKKVSFSGQEGGPCYLGNTRQACKEFGYPKVSLQTMIEWQADWIQRGEATLGKPTHFEVSDGKY